MTNRDQQIQQFEVEYKESIEKVLNISFNISTLASPKLDDWIDIKLKINDYNHFLKSTEYYEKPEKLYHFTNLRVLYSILNERSIRMYNLNNSNMNINK